MANQIRDIIDRIRKLDDELEKVLAEKAEEFSYRLENRRVIFQQAALERQREFREALWRYVLNAKILSILTAPVIYGLIVPLAALDVAVTVYQQICFRAYRIPRVRRRDHFVIDRHKLAYLNLLQKLNCVYCGYANGLLAYTSEIAARTEAYWCPIKHGRSLRRYHGWYGDFSDFGDAENFREDWRESIRKVRSQDD